MTDSLPELTGPAIGKRVRHRTMFNRVEGIVIAETDTELKVRQGFRFGFVATWIPRVCTEEVRHG